MPRLIWGFAGCTYHIVGNLVSRLIFIDIKLVYKKYFFYPTAMGWSVQLVGDQYCDEAGKDIVLCHCTTKQEFNFLISQPKPKLLAVWSGFRLFAQANLSNNIRFIFFGAVSLYAHNFKCASRKMTLISNYLFILLNNQASHACFWLQHIIMFEIF